MKLSTLVTSVSVAVAVTLAASQLASGARQPEKDAKKGNKDGAGAQPDMQAMMEEMAKPGEEHRLLAHSVGTWDCTTRTWMPGPDGKMAEATEKGEAKFTSELEGRWIRQDYKGAFGGMAFAGIGYNGYDKATKKYISTWMDNMSTSMMNLTGTYDAAKKSFTYTGSMLMPGMGDMAIRCVSEEKDANTFTFTMYHAGPDGKEMKDMEITYKRRG
jgi:hypothetical protein